jgi:hypothetical protein
VGVVVGAPPGAGAARDLGVRGRIVGHVDRIGVLPTARALFPAARVLIPIAQVLLPAAQVLCSLVQVPALESCSPQSALNGSKSNGKYAPSWNNFIASGVNLGFRSGCETQL